MMFTVSGRIPSKKNSKEIAYRYVKNNGLIKKVPFIRSQPGYNKWENDAALCFKGQNVGINKIDKNKKISLFSVSFTFGDKRRTDLTNKLESIMDSLVVAGVIEDDSWQVVPSLSVSGKYEKGVFGCSVLILQ